MRCLFKLYSDIIWKIHEQIAKRKAEWERQKNFFLNAITANLFITCGMIKIENEGGMKAIKPTIQIV